MAKAKTTTTTTTKMKHADEMKSSDCVGQFFTINVDFLHFPVYVSLGNKLDVTATLLAKALDDDAEFIYSMLREAREDDVMAGTVMGECIRLATGEVLIMIGNYPETPDDIVSIAHEVSHATHFIYEMINTPLCPETTEVYAYLNGYLIEQILERLQISLKPGRFDRVTVDRSANKGTGMIKVVNTRIPPEPINSISADLPQTCKCQKK